jgi:phage shock protein A
MENYEQQVADQKAQVENLKVVLRKLEQKLAEAQSRANVLVSQHRRSRALARAGDAELAMRDSSQGITFDRLENKVVRAAAVSQAKAEMLADNVDEQLTALDRGEQVEKLLAEIKARRDSA